MFMNTKNLRRLSLILSLLTLSSSPSFAAGPGYVLADDAEQRVKQLTGHIFWYDDLEQAKAEAKYNHKMVLWLQMLGRLDGAT